MILFVCARRCLTVPGSDRGTFLGSMTSFDAGVVTTTFVVAVFAAKSFFKRHTQHGSLFQYEDGEATQISIAEFTASQPYAQATSWAASGLIASVVASTSRGRGAFEDAEFMFVLSMRTASWVRYFRSEDSGSRSEM